jgi:hypothetical protein
MAEKTEPESLSQLGFVQAPRQLHNHHASTVDLDALRKPIPLRMGIQFWIWSFSFSQPNGLCYLSMNVLGFSQVTAK